jgi:type 1 glutamine amidotransferase
MNAHQLLRSGGMFLLFFMLATSLSNAAEKKLVLIAGKQTHGPGDHEFRAGCLLLKKCLDAVPGIHAEVYTNGWPADDGVFVGADAILVYADGGGGHPAIRPERIKLLDSLAQKGVGIACAHYGVEVPKGESGDALHRWIGGYYETAWSVNPMWVPEFNQFPNHPITRGVKPFALYDEWYFNMRWTPDRKGVTPILVAKPSDQVRAGPYVSPRGPYDHIVAASGREEVMMWAFERPDGGRGFGFTGGHQHVNWSNDNFRKVVLNALLWIAKAEVPANGVASTVKPEDIPLNLDPKGAPVSSRNLTGTWTFSVESQGETNTATIAFVQAGANLLGTYRGNLGEHAVFGSIRGNSANWNFNAKVQDRDVRVRFDAALEQDETIKGTVKLGDRSGNWTAKHQAM